LGQDPQSIDAAEAAGKSNSRLKKGATGSLSASAGCRVLATTRADKPPVAPRIAGGIVFQQAANTRIGRIRGWAAASCWCLCALGVSVHLTVRDRYDGWAVAFYALSPAVMALLAAVAAGLLCSRPTRRLSATSLLLCVACGVWFYASAYYDNSVVTRFSKSATSVRVLFWNVGRGRFGWSGIEDELATIDAQFVGLVEAEASGGERPEFTGAAFDGWQVRFPGHGFALLARGEIERTAVHALGGGSTCVEAEVDFDGATLTAVVVDIKSNPLRSRREAFTNLIALLNDLRDRPVVLMGDFNTPPESVYFDALRARHSNVFETRGSGFSTTWPVPVPVLALDQIWLNQSVQAGRCELFWSWASDHRPVLAQIGILDEGRSRQRIARNTANQR